MGKNTTEVPRESPDVLLVRNGELFVRERSSGGGFDFVRVTEVHAEGLVRFTSVLEGKPYMKVHARLQSDGSAEIRQEGLSVRFHIPGSHDLRQYELGINLLDRGHDKRGRSLLAWK